jgi:hypothetical protein
VDPQEANWSPTEQEIAKQAFDAAYERDLLTLTRTLQSRSSAIATAEDIWNLHDFLSAKRHEFDGRYDFRYPSLLFVFAELIKTNLLQISELKGLAEEKLAKISALTRI